MTDETNYCEQPELVVAVTGATGFLGRRVVRRLAQDGLHIRCAVRPSSDVEGLRRFVGERLWRQIDIQQVRLASLEDCRRFLQDVEIVFHLAAALKGGPAAMFANTVVPTRRLVQAACEQRVTRFVLVSSLGVYGAALLPKGAVLDETVPVDPRPYLRDPYTYSKVVQEEVAWQAQQEHGLPLVVVRPGVIFGDERGCLSNRVGLRLGGLLLRMGGRQPLPYTYVENCAEAVVLAGLTPRLEGHIINVVDDELPTGKRLLKELRRSGHKLKVVPVPRPAVSLLARFCHWYSRWSKGQIPPVLTPYKAANAWKPLRYSNERAKRLLGWQPRVNLQEALQRSLTT